MRRKEPKKEPISPAPPQQSVLDAEKVALDGLPRKEIAAEMLAVDHGALKPMTWLNNEHYKILLKSNALDATLTRRIEAFRACADSPESDTVAACK
tara:strand:+ start:2065 stop:2352 length:288 start_codon:yes stop_codon:yes gene_type:complete